MTETIIVANDHATRSNGNGDGDDRAPEPRRVFLNQVQNRGDSIVVSRDGKPVAALVDYALYERIRRLRESFTALTDRLGQVHADVPAETAVAEINAAVRDVRHRPSR